MSRQFQLIEAVHEYLPEFDEGVLDKAYRFAKNAHKGQKRASGESYFSHPWSVALIAAQLRLDFPSIVAALLHDTAEDTQTSLATIESLFGADVAQLVDGVTKLRKISFSPGEKHQAENARKLLLAIASDIRILFIKLCDRLHNMRTLHHLVNPEKRRRIAQETLDIFAVLASRIGLRAVQEELENLAFAELRPEEYQRLAQKIEMFGAQDPKIIGRIIRIFEELFREHSFFPDISGRHKTPYSIWSKMQRQHVRFEELTDVVAFRFVLPDVESCYRALGILHTNFRMLPTRFKDYMSLPKPNGYRSLHTAILGPFNKPIEIQIRTTEMEVVAESGKCAHWAYKNNWKGTESYKWLKGLLEIFNTNVTPKELFRRAKHEMFSKGIFCFTPLGDLISLPEGATAVDFAYAVHTNIGNSCIGARIDGHIAPLWAVLQNGANVEILTDPDQHPSALWDQFAITGKARACIQKFVCTQERAEFTRLGQRLLQQQLARLEEGFPQEETFVRLAKSFGYGAQRDFQEAIGRGRVPYTLVGNKVQRLGLPLRTSFEVVPLCLSDFIPGIAMHYADCCHPIAQNPIVGELIPGRGVMIHTIPCMKGKKSNTPFIETAWGKLSSQARTCLHLNLTISNQLGSFAIILGLLRDLEIRTTHIRVAHRDLDLIRVVAEIQVEREEQLAEALASLRTCPRVQAVDVQR
ncbi:MAG: RelA/SpoT family protein [Holosporales bacterium]|jgi:GTP pyrophosphokinase|nr:RelA/SpoT family protein [Holosporales bacterium]